MIEVPGGNVAALYAAVYDENGMPRSHAEITLEPGLYVLDPSKPFDGRLVLGERSILRSSFKMALDANGVPQVSESNEPIVLHAGAKIDGSNLAAAAFGEGIIVVGDRGLVEQLWVYGGLRPGVEITSTGTARQVASTGHSAGFRVRAAGQKAQATLEANLAAGNMSYGIGVIALDPDLVHPTHGSVDVRATLQRNASLNNGIVNLFVNGGIGTDGSKVSVEATHNVFRGSASVANVRAIGGFDFQAHGSANHNRVTLILDDNLVADGPVGIRVEGGTLNTGFLSNPSLPLAERQSSNNAVEVNISNVTFHNNIADIVAYGALASLDESGGNHNTVKVIIQPNTPQLTIAVFDCFPPENFPNCTSTVTLR